MASAKKLLVIGGTRQIGKRFLEQLEHLCTNQSWDVTVFSRGNNYLPTVSYPITHIFGDRNTEDIEQLTNRDWDVVLDCVAYNPSSLNRFLEVAKGRIGRYILISTVAVYDLNTVEDGIVNEFTARKKFSAAQLAAPGMRFYGECKAATEDALFSQCDLQSLVLRPFFIVGKYDYNNLDHYWTNRLRRYNDIIIPEGLHLIQRTYLEDLIRIIVHFLEAPILHNTYLAVTEDPISIQEYLLCNMAILNREVSLVPIPESILKENGVRPIFDLPYTCSENKIIYDNSLLKSVLPFEFQSTKVIQGDILQLNNRQGLAVEGTIGLSRTIEESLLGKQSS
jgi:nucleoside-diphosphate-sugar epimerase